VWGVSAATSLGGGGRVVAEAQHQLDLAEVDITMIIGDATEVVEVGSCGVECGLCGLCGLCGVGRGLDAPGTPDLTCAGRASMCSGCVARLLSLGATSVRLGVLAAKQSNGATQSGLQSMARFPASGLVSSP